MTSPQKLDFTNKKTEKVYVRSPHIGELPPAPEGKSGWPWTEISETLP